MVTVDLSNAGIIEVRVNAFTPEDAHAIAEAILAEFEQGGEPALRPGASRTRSRYSREELTLTEDQLRDVRQQLADFRREHRIIDPSGDVQRAGRDRQRAAVRARPGDGRARHDPDLRRRQGPAGGPGRPPDRRDLQAHRGRARRDGERRRSRARCPTWSATTRRSGSTSRSPAPPTPAPSAGYAAAEAEARRQSRYLAPHIQPTMARGIALSAARLMLAAMATLFLVLGWGIMLLIYYNVRDNNNR